jgi:hypothetical protein
MFVVKFYNYALMQTILLQYGVNNYQKTEFEFMLIKRYIAISLLAN